MRYFGSKTSTVERIFHLISKRIPTGSFCDPFGGIGTVGSFFKQKGYSIWSGDILTFAHYFQIAKITINEPLHFHTLCTELHLPDPSTLLAYMNAHPPQDGPFVEEYARVRMFFTEDNAKKIEACRQLIMQWKKDGLIDYTEQAVLFASLVNCMDKVANTAGTYYAHLKQWYRKALKPFLFHLLPHISGGSQCRSFLCEAKALLEKREFDIVYLDPPHNSRSYSRYYHLPETVVTGDIPSLHGRSGMPSKLLPDCAFNKPSKASAALQELLAVARFRLLIFHYSDSGIIAHQDVLSLLSRYGYVNKFSVVGKGYTTKHNARTVSHDVYLVHND